MTFSRNTCTQTGTPLINGFDDHALWSRWRNGDTSFTLLWDIAKYSKFTGGSVREYKLWFVAKIVLILYAKNHWNRVKFVKVIQD